MRRVVTTEMGKNYLQVTSQEKTVLRVCAEEKVCITMQKLSFSLKCNSITHQFTVKKTIDRKHRGRNNRDKTKDRCKRLVITFI